jgi:hypothetical protein
MEISLPMRELEALRDCITSGTNLSTPVSEKTQNLKAGRVASGEFPSARCFELETAYALRISTISGLWPGIYFVSFPFHGRSLSASLDRSLTDHGPASESFKKLFAPSDNLRPVGVLVSI